MFDAAWARRTRLGAGAGPLIGLRLALSPNIWRIGPAWAVLAGAVAGGGVLFNAEMPLRLVGAVVLADSAWGAIWRLTTITDDAIVAPLDSVAGESRLPYFHRAAPAARWLDGLRQVGGGASWHEFAIAIALAIFLGVLLGAPALVLSLVVLVVSAWAWVLARSGKQPASCDALLNAGLPWLLGLTLAQDMSRIAAMAPAVALGVAVTVGQWGVRRAYLAGRDRRDRLMGAWLGPAFLVLVLIALSRPLAAAVVTVILLPVGWWLGRVASRSLGVEGALRYGAPWWLAAMLLSAVALR